LNFRDRKRHVNVEKEKAHLLSLGVSFSFVRKFSVHATLYDKNTEEYPFPGTLGQSDGCLTIQKTALYWGCRRAAAVVAMTVAERGSTVSAPHSLTRLISTLLHDPILTNLVSAQQETTLAGRGRLSPKLSDADDGDSGNPEVSPPLASLPPMVAPL